MTTPRKAGRMTIWQRTEAKERFLEVFAATHNIRKSCRQAGINRWTFYTWRRNGTLSDIDIAFAEDCYRDEIKERVAVHNFDPWDTISYRQLMILARRYLPEMRERKFGEILLDTRLWNLEERQELDRLIAQTQAVVAERRKQHIASKQRAEYI